MIARAVKVGLQDIQSLRALFLQETNFQIRYDACHERGWTDSYSLMLDDVPVGYGSIKGQAPADRDAVFEFFVIPTFRKHSRILFHELLAASGVRTIECQTNDAPLSAMLHECSETIRATAVLFEDHAVTEHVVPGIVVRRRCDEDRVFAHDVEPIGDYVVARGNDIVATGGFLLHYNPPFADLFMEVRPDCRRQGYGSFLVQELKKNCYLAGRVPAARCGLGNIASRAALEKAGLRVCGFLLTGTVVAH
jgi:GNAT superfamily N-acetyltransferase